MISPMPAPTTAMVSAMTRYGVPTPTSEMPARPSDITARPPAMVYRVPRRAVTRSLVAAVAAIATANGTAPRPALSGL